MLPIKPDTGTLARYPFHLDNGLTRSQLDGQRLSRSQDRITNRHARRLFVYLDRRLVRVDSDNFTDELVVPDPNLNSERVGKSTGNRDSGGNSPTRTCLRRACSLRSRPDPRRQRRCRIGPRVLHRGPCGVDQRGKAKAGESWTEEAYLGKIPFCVLHCACHVGGDWVGGVEG